MAQGWVGQSVGLPIFMAFLRLRFHYARPARREGAGARKEMRSTFFLCMFGHVLANNNKDDEMHSSISHSRRLPRIDQEENMYKSLCNPSRGEMLENVDWKIKLS